jgi:hypothetical protein
MKRITTVLLISTLFLGLHSEGATAQYSSSTQARELLQELQDARSVTRIGISWLDYGQTARNIQIKLDRFLRSSDANEHPLGYNLKTTAEAYLRARGESAKYWSPRVLWNQAQSELEITETCIANPKMEPCESINLANQKKLENSPIYNFLIEKEPSYKLLLKSVFVTPSKLEIKVISTDSFTSLSSDNQSSILVNILNDTRSFLKENDAFITFYDAQEREILCGNYCLK